MSNSDQIMKELKGEKHELECLESEIHHMRERLLDRVPERFSKRDMVNSFFGSLTIGITFILKGGTVKTAVGLDILHTEMIVVATLLVLFAEIYFIGYSRVKDKSTRHLGQFMTKRLSALYAITIIISFCLVYLLNLNNSAEVSSFYDVMKIVVVVAFPCAIGAAVPSLLRKY